MVCVWKDGPFVSCERFTVFDRDEPKFLKAVKDFGNSPASEVLATIDDFMLDWLVGMEEDQLFMRYDFKPLKYVQRPYGLFQIRAGPKRKNLGYRAVLLFYDRESHAGWVYAFKKDPKRESQEIKLAVARADEYWDKINRMRGIR